MRKKLYEINKEGFNEIDNTGFLAEKDKESSLFLIDIKTGNREKVVSDLKEYNLPDEVCDRIIHPSDNLRFEYVDGYLCGEIAYFSSKAKKPDLAGIVIHNNVLFLIHKFDAGFLAKITKSFSSFTEKQKSNILNIESLLYYIIHEVLSFHGKLILSYREKVEQLADKFENDRIQVTPEDILEYKSQVSDLSRVIEKLIYTLSQPPAENVLDLDNPYRPLFDNLIAGIQLFKNPLEHTQDRLDSLNDHYQLLMQDKMNRRLNFLTIIQAIFAPLTLIAGIYGMNFKYMPELDLKYGYFITLGIMIVTAVFFIRYFYRNGWFKL